MILKTFIILIFLFSFSVFGQNGIKCIDGDCVNGTGISEDNAGIRYEGSFQGGVKTGKGKQTDSQGNIYVGDWKNDLPNGKGVYTVTSGEQKKYTGYFKDGNYHGIGTLNGF